jgi:hypothetical protein
MLLFQTDALHGKSFKVEKMTPRKEKMVVAFLTEAGYLLRCRHPGLNYSMYPHGLVKESELDA